MTRFYLAVICIFLSSISQAESKKLNGLTLHPQVSFELKIPSPVFLAGDALVMNSGASQQIQFIYGEIKLPAQSMILVSKSTDQLWIQNLNKTVQVSFKNGNQIELWPYFEVSFKRDMNSSDGFVIDQFRPLDLKSYLKRYQQITKPHPQSLISYGRSLRKQIEKAKVQFAESAQETSKRKIASVDEGEQERIKNERKTKQLRKTLRQQYEERALGHTLKPST